jgi:hypothetical protein
MSAIGQKRTLKLVKLKDIGMGRVSVLAGVAHDIAHHAASGLSYISPHLALALREAGLQTTHIELLATDPYPERVAELRPLRLALATLHSTTLAILRKHKFEETDVSSVVLHATPVPWDMQGYSLHTRVTITTHAGRRSFDSGWLSGA